MKLKELTEIKTNFQEADFWIIRRGSQSKVGKPVREFNVESIGIKVIRTDILIPDYLFYVFIYLKDQGYWTVRIYGSLPLVHIRTEDVRNIEVSQRP